MARWPDEAPTAADMVALADTRLYTDKQARKARRGESLPGRDTVAFGNTVLDVRTREVSGPLGRAKLSPREAEVLHVLASCGPQVVPRGDLAGPGRHGGSEAGSVLDAHISTLRRKLASVTAHAGIRTVRGQGFSLHWYGEHGGE